MLRVNASVEEGGESLSPSVPRHTQFTHAESMTHSVRESLANLRKLTGEKLDDGEGLDQFLREIECLAHWTGDVKGQQFEAGKSTAYVCMSCIRYTAADM